MEIFEKISDTTAYLEAQKSKNKTIGFVPTMGALHEGHLELMRRAKKENDILAVSVFVNPIQFNNPEDLKKYPRDLKKDIDKLGQVGCEVLFSPDVMEMYPTPVTTQYDFGPLETVMEGAFRQGHFNGVALVVKKLFDIIQPDKSYFGEKDFQQLAIIKRLVEMENIPVKIVPCPIVREKDGLAMSSRNARLSNNERNIAPFIFQTLVKAKEKSTYLTPDEIRFMVENVITDTPEFRLEYFEIADDIQLQPVYDWSDSKGIMGFIAVHLGNIRLIDNIRFI
jgi:pantoate--beta-alanine ligase